MVRLFAPTATDFSTLGIGVLSDRISNKITEGRNDEFTLEMEYPFDGQFYNQITERAFLVCKSNPNSSQQIFRIVRVSEDSKKRTAKIYGEHISYDLSGIILRPFAVDSLAEAFAGFVSNATVPCPFSFSTDKTVDGVFSVDTPSSIRSWLGGRTGSILDVYGTGEYEFDNYNVILHLHRGQNRNITIRYGKNLTELRRERKYDIYTGAVGFWKSEDGTVIQTGIINVAGTFSFTRILAIDFSNEYETAPSVAMLTTRTQSYIVANNIGVPKVTFEIKFENLEKYPEYADISALEQVNLCDTVGLYYPDLDITASAEVIKTVYDEMLDVYDSITIGDVKASFTDDLVSAQQSIETRLSSAEATLTVQNGQIALKASQSSVDTLSGRVTSAESSIEQNAQQIALRVTQSDVSNAIDAIDEFHAGTVVTITAQQTKIATPIFEVDISDSDEQLKLDEGGGVMTNLSVTEHIEAPNIAERYTGKYGRVEIGSNGDYSNYIGFADAVSDKIILEDIDVWSEADFYGVLYLHGIHGSGNITIHMNYDDDNDVNAYHSQIGLRNNGVVIVFDGCCFKANISVEGQTTVKFTNCFFKAGAASCLSMIDGVTAWMDGCTLNGTGNLIELVRGVHLSAQNIAGTTTGNFIFARFATICWYGTRPQGSNNTAISLTTPSDLSTLTVDPGDGGSLIPSEPITVDLTATLTDAYYWTSNDSDAGWYGGGRLIQGIKTFRHAAVMWFNTNAFTGKTIKNATLTIKRISGQGRTTTVGIQVYTTPLSTNGGNPRTNSVYYDNIGSIANGQTKTFTIPVAAIQAIANGTMKGLMLWPNDTAVLDGREYSANYARFEGTTGTAPVLTVTYQ